MILFMQTETNNENGMKKSDNKGSQHRVMLTKITSSDINTHIIHCNTITLGNVTINSVVVSCTPPPGPYTSHSVPPLWPVC